MPTRDTPFAPGTPCWIDLFTSDPAKAKAFYTGLFEWTFTDAGEEFGGYVNFQSEGLGVAGMMGGNSPESSFPDAWNTYVCVADIDASLAAATEAGATVIAPAMTVADLGSMAMLSDPIGGGFGLWQPGKHTGFGKYNEPNSVTWDEYHSKDFATSTEFYANLFGWSIEKTADTDAFRYFSGQLAGETVAA
jgi:predicted enzyme related to lactoylglutathione lyase